MSPGRGRDSRERERVVRILVAWVLALAPRWYREARGEEIRSVHEARWRDVRGVSRRAVFAVRELSSLALMGLRLRVGGAGPVAGAVGTRKRGASVLETMWQDVKYGVRTLRRNPGFTAAAVVVLALGIGATTAIFSGANAYFFRPLPFADAGRLVMLYETNPEFGWTDANVAPANALDWREQVEAFEDVAMYSEFVSPVTWIRNGEPDLVGLATVTGNFFDVLGVKPVLGRVTRDEETWEGHDGIVVLSWGLWQSRFGGDPSVVGRRFEIGGTTVEVAGVMPQGFTFPRDDVQLWSTFGWPEGNRQEVWFRRAHWPRAVARLAPGVTFEQADAQLQVVVRRLQAEYPTTNSVMGAGLTPFRDFLIRDVRRTLLVLLGAVGLLLLLACTNVANLLLVRANGRKREVALRHAMGAGRVRIARQMLTESLILALAGGAAGLVVGWAGIRLMAGLSRVGIDGATGLALDSRVILFALAASGASAVLFGMAPALRSTGGRLHEALKEGGRSRSTSRESNRVAGLLVAVEVALALLLAAGAGLMVRSMWLLRHVEPGFRTEGVVAVQFTVPSARYADRDAVLAFYDRFEEALEARPGIERAGTVGQLPLNGVSWSSQFQAKGWPPDRVGFEILHRRADNGYFEALGIPLLGGRMFQLSDRPDGPPVVLINEAFAREHFSGEDPIGQQIAFDRAAGPGSIWNEIIGIVGDQKQENLRDPARPEVFESRNQDWNRTVWTVVRASVDPGVAIPAIRETLRDIDPLIPIANVQPLHDVWSRSMARERFVLVLFGVFAGVALLLAAVGVYGVTAQALRARTSEIGVRMALGAAARDVVRMMLRQTVGLVLLGLATGLVAAFLAARALDSLVFGVSARDPGTFAAVALFLALVALLASWMPARRASTVDPAVTLRSD